MLSSQRAQAQKRRRSPSPIRSQDRRGYVSATPPLPPIPRGDSPLCSPRPIPYHNAPVGFGFSGGGAEASAVRAARVQVLQDVLRRTSLAELRDREIVDWLNETEEWLRNGEAAFCHPAAMYAETSKICGMGQSGCSATPAANYHFPGAAELRLLVLGVLHTMPWWRVVESVETSLPSAARQQRALGVTKVTKATGTVASSQCPPGPASSTCTVAAQHVSMSAAKAVTRWHEKIQVSFERVCLVLVAQSEHTVPGVLEVVMRPFHLRPPVRDGAKRAIPTDSFLRIINAVAALYSTTYVLELFKTFLDSLLPKRRWQDRRHHLASTAMLLHLALESLIPAFQPGTGNAHCLEDAQVLMQAAEALVPSVNDKHNASPDHAVAVTESSIADAMTSDATGNTVPLQLPVNTMQAQELLQQQPPNSDVDMSDGVNSLFSSSQKGDRQGGGCGGGAAATVGGLSSSKNTFFAVRCNNNNQAATPRTMLVQLPSKLQAATIDSNRSASTGKAATNPQHQQDGLIPPMISPQNNRMLSCRTEIIRVLLQRLLEMELALTGDTSDDGLGLLGDDFSESASLASTSFSGTASNPWWASHRRIGGAAATATAHSPALLAIAATRVPPPVVDASAKRALNLQTQPALSCSGPASSSRLCESFPMSTFSTLVNRQNVAPDARPFLDILSDCTKLAFLTLAEDLRRQQAAGVCGNADWWREVVTHFLNAVRRVERPKCLLFLAPSLAMLGEEEQAVDLLHKLVSLVTKGYMPSLGPTLPSSGVHHDAGRWPASSQLRGTPSPLVSGGGGSGAIGGLVAVPMRMRRVSQHPSSLSAHPVPMQERLRAAMFIFPLLRFLQSHISSADGVRRRLVKWVSQEMRGGYDGLREPSIVGRSTVALAGGSSTARRSSSSAGGGSVSRIGRAPSRLVEIVFAQSAAMAAVQTEREAPPHTRGNGSVPSTVPLAVAVERPSPGLIPAQTTAALTEGDWREDALRPLVDRFTVPAEDGNGTGKTGVTSASTEQLLDLAQMKAEGLLSPCLMDGCPWATCLPQC